MKKLLCWIRIKIFGKKLPSCIQKEEELTFVINQIVNDYNKQTKKLEDEKNEYLNRIKILEAELADMKDLLKGK